MLKPKICSVHCETVRQLPLFEPRFGPKYKSDPRKSEVQLSSARSAATCLSRMRFPNTGTGFEAEETRDFKILNGRVTMRNRAGSATGHAMQPAEF